VRLMYIFSSLEAAASVPRARAQAMGSRLERRFRESQQPRPRYYFSNRAYISVIGKAVPVMYVCRTVLFIRGSGKRGCTVDPRALIPAADSFATVHSSCFVTCLIRNGARIRNLMDYVSESHA